MMNIEDYTIFQEIRFNDELYAHLCVENNEYPLNESKGIPDGLEDDATYLAKIIYNDAKRNSWKDCVINIVDINNLRLRESFDSLKIIVKISEDKFEGECNTPKQFTKHRIITIYMPENPSILFIKTQIAHELIHCYVYNLSNTIGSSDLSYYAISRYESQEDLIRFIVYALMYYFNDDEVNAFVGELQIEMAEKSPKTMREGYKILFGTKIYKTYLAVYEAFENKVDDYDKWCDVYREMNEGDKNLSNNQIIRKIQKRFEYIKKRLWKIIPRIMKENLFQGTIDKSSNTFFEYLRKFEISH